jgi:hypothetical protein
MSVKTSSQARSEDFQGANGQEPPPEPEPAPEPSWQDAMRQGQCSSQELSSLDIAQRPLLIDQWCKAGDLGFIFASRGLGKTWQAMHLAHGLATGQDVGPWKIHAQVKVLYLDGEMPPADVKERDRVLGQPTQNLVYINHELLFERAGKIMNLANQEFQNATLQFCIDNSFKVLFLDNLSCLASGVDENTAIDWEKILPWLLRLRRAHITVIFIHHAGRNNQMRGSSKREDPAFWVLRLDLPNDPEDKPGAHFISHFTKWRSALRPKSYLWSYCPSHDSQITVQVKEVSPLSIFRSLIENGLEYCSQIAEEMNVSLGYVSQLARIGVSEGWLKKEKRKYILVAEQ